MFNNKFKISITLMLCLITSIALAATKLPKHYPSQLDTVGKITKVVKQKRIIELDGTAYRLHPVHEIYTKRKGRQATLYNLRTGMKVGLEFTTYQGRRAVNKVWILPKNYPSTKHTH